jgi:opacity protein-like surface antigen
MSVTENSLKVSGEEVFVQADDPVPFNFEVDTAGRVGFRLNFLTATRWGAELYYGYDSTTASYVLRDDPTVRLDLPIQNHGLGVNILYYPVGNGYPLATSGRLTPFVTGGVGAAIFRPTSEAKEIASDPLQGNLPDIIESSQVAYSYGAGVKYRLNRIFGVRGDVRGYLAKNPTFGLPTSSTDPNASVIPLEGYIHNTEISAGVIINFGSRP